MVQSNMVSQSPCVAATAVQMHPHWWNEHQAPLVSHRESLSLTKVVDDGSESTHSGSQSEPPMSPEPPKLSLTAPGKPPDLSPSCSTLGSKSTNASPLALMIDTDCLASPISAGGRQSMSLESFSVGQPMLGYDQTPAAEQSNCGTPTALPPPPAYYAPLVSVPGLPPAPALPPGVPEPPKAPPRLPANVPTTIEEPSPPWPKTAPPAASAPWQMGQHMKVPLQQNVTLCDHQFNQMSTMSSALPTGLVTTPVCTPTGGVTSSVMLPPNSPSLAMQPPPQPMPDLSLLSSSPPAPLLAVDPNMGMPATPAAGSTIAFPSFDDDVTVACNFLALLQPGPQVPPLPPSGCYGSIFISSAISESLGAAAEAVEAAARDLGDKPVKVLLPWYPATIGNGMFDHTKPAKVGVS